MTQRITEMSPRFLARMAAVLGFLEGVASVNGQLRIPGRLVVSTDAAATAANILGNESLFRLGARRLRPRGRVQYRPDSSPLCLVQACGQDRRFAHSVLRTRGDCSSGWRQSRSTPGLGPLEEREGFWRIQRGTTTVHGAPFPPMERARLQPLPRVLRVLLHTRWLRHLQVDVERWKEQAALGQ